MSLLYRHSGFRIQVASPGDNVNSFSGNRGTLCIYAGTYAYQLLNKNQQSPSCFISSSLFPPLKRRQPLHDLRRANTIQESAPAISEGRCVLFRREIPARRTDNDIQESQSHVSYYLHFSVLFLVRGSYSTRGYSSLV